MKGHAEPVVDDATDARWCERQDAIAVGDEPDGDAVLVGMTDPRWAREESFYDGLKVQVQSRPEGFIEVERAVIDDIIDQAILADDAPGIVPPRSSQASLRWLTPLIAVAAAALLWVVWPGPDATRALAGTWVAQRDGTRHDGGGALPLAMWLVADDETCGSVGEAVVCASSGTIVRIGVPRPGALPRIEVERGSVTVAHGTWTVVTGPGERTLSAGESFAVPASAVVATALPTGPGDVTAPAPALSAERFPDPSTDPHAVEPGTSVASQPAAPKHAEPSRPGRSGSSEDAATLLARARSRRGQGDAKRAAQSYARLIRLHLAALKQKSLAFPWVSCDCSRGARKRRYRCSSATWKTGGRSRRRRYGVRFRPCSVYDERRHWRRRSILLTVGFLAASTVTARVNW
ncbi:MAG: hypothetical protein JKY37_08105 [Nannocystaceae bacterium]|nr:hypothetical protein [Nannocystaceae bacterium]